VGDVDPGLRVADSVTTVQGVADSITTAASQQQRHNSVKRIWKGAKYYQRLIPPAYPQGEEGTADVSKKEEGTADVCKKGARPGP
jgi:hypothetical protein